MADTKDGYTAPARPGYLSQETHGDLPRAAQGNLLRAEHGHAPQAAHGHAPRAAHGHPLRAASNHAPRPLGALLPPLTRPVLRRLHPGAAQVMADWEALVGPGLAGRTTPRALDRGTLTIACAGPVAMELTMLGPQVIARINAGLGRAAVQRLRFIQAAVPRPAPRAPLPPVTLPSGLEDRLAAMPEGPLRDALAKLAQGVYRKPS